MEITTEANAQEIALLVRELAARAESKASAMVVRYGPVFAWSESLHNHRKRGQRNGIQSISKYRSGWCFVPVTRNLGWLEKRTYFSTTSGLVVLIRPFCRSTTVKLYVG
jgi:hypothetical protein